MFDAGLSSSFASDYIFLTHGHVDHSASLYFHTLSPVPEGKKRIIYVPEEIQEKVNRYLLASYEIGCDDEIPFDREVAAYTIVGVSPRTELDIIHNGKKHQAVVYENDHSVPCRSYGIKEQVKSLKEEYRGLEGKELGRLRKSGVVIEEFKWVSRFVYIGDTTEKVFEINPDLFEYKSIIIECTFLYDDDLEQAGLTKHCHWRTLRPIIEAHPENNFVLYHFSMRYRPHEIEEFFREGGENFLINVHPWLHS